MIIAGGQISRIEPSSQSLVTVERPITLEPENTTAVDSGFFTRYPLVSSLISSHKTVVCDSKTGNYYVINNEEAASLGVKESAIINLI